MTVSRALNTPQLVRPKTVEKVMQAVQATGYIPNALAGGLASRRSKLVAVVVPQINNNMFVDTIQALSDTLAARGYHMLLCVAGYSRQTEAELVATLLSRRPDGVVLTGIQHAPALKKTILNAATPVVEIWDLTPTPLDMLVGFSHEKVGETIGEYLLEKATAARVCCGPAMRARRYESRGSAPGWPKTALTMRRRSRCRFRHRWRWGVAGWPSCSPAASLTLSSAAPIPLPRGRLWKPKAGGCACRRIWR